MNQGKEFKVIKSARCTGREFCNLAGVYFDCDLIGHENLYFPRKHKIDDSEKYKPGEWIKYAIKRENKK